jgi:cell division septum initiation protein DivIVA
MSMHSREIQPQLTMGSFRRGDNEGMDQFLQNLADGFLVLMEQNRQRGKQIEELSRDIAWLRHTRRQSESAAVISPATTEEADQPVWQALDRLRAEVASLRAEMRPVAATGQGGGNDSYPFRKPASFMLVHQDNGPATGASDHAPLVPESRSSVNQAAPKSTADSVYNRANLLYKLNDLLFNPGQRKLCLFGNMEHLPLLPILAIVFIQQHLLPAFQRMALPLG